jgi:hypothetical protein
MDLKKEAIEMVLCSSHISLISYFFFGFCYLWFEEEKKLKERTFFFSAMETIVYARGLVDAIEKRTILRYEKSLSKLRWHAIQHAHPVKKYATFVTANFTCETCHGKWRSDHIRVIITWSPTAFAIDFRGSKCLVCHALRKPRPVHASIDHIIDACTAVICASMLAPAATFS